MLEGSAVICVEEIQLHEMMMYKVSPAIKIPTRNKQLVERSVVPEIGSILEPRQLRQSPPEETFFCMSLGSDLDSNLDSNNSILSPSTETEELPYTQNTASLTKQTYRFISTISPITMTFNSPKDTCSKKTNSETSTSSIAIMPPRPNSTLTFEKIDVPRRHTHQERIASITNGASTTSGHNRY